MKISQKLKLTALVVLVLLVANATVGIYLIRRMTRDVRQLTEVEEPLKEAILEMEINAGETARAVLNYIRDHEERDIDRMRDSERDFERFAKEFERLAETDEERGLGRQVAALYRDFKTLGDEITNLTDHRLAVLQTLRTNREKINELVDERLKVSIDLTSPDAPEKTRAVLLLDEVLDHDHQLYQHLLSHYNCLLTLGLFLL